MLRFCSARFGRVAGMRQHKALEGTGPVNLSHSDNLFRQPSDLTFLLGPGLNTYLFATISQEVPG